MTCRRTLIVGLIALVSAALPIALCAQAERARAVAQLELVDLRPVSVRFVPGREGVLVVLNEHGRIDVLDISREPGDSDDASAKRLGEFAAGAASISVRTSGPASSSVSTFDGRRIDQQIVSGGRDGRLRRWTLGGEPIGTPVETGAGPVSVVALSPNGERMVSVGENGDLRFWKDVPLWNDEVEPESLSAPLATHENVTSVTFSFDDRRIVSGHEDGELRLWTREGEVIGTPLDAHEGAVRSVAFSPDDRRFVSGGADGTLRLWTREGEPIGDRRDAHEGAVRGIAFSPDGRRFVSGGEDGTLRLWTREGEPIGTPLDAHEGAVRSIAFSPDGLRVVSGSADGTVRLWRLGGAALERSGERHGSAVRDVAFSSDGQRIVSGSEDGTLRLWTREGEPIGEPIATRTAAVRSVAFSADGQRIAYGGKDGTVGLLTLANGALANGALATLPGPHDREVHSIAFSPDGKWIASGGEDGTLRRWTHEGKPSGEPIETYTGAVRSVAFSADGQHIVSGGEDGALQLWTTREGRMRGIPPEELGEGVVRSVALSPDGEPTIAGTYDIGVRLWTREEEPVGSFVEGRGSPVRSVAFSPDGKRLVIGTREGVVKLWTRDEAGGWHAVPLDGDVHRLPVYSVAFSPDGQRIVSGDGEGLVQLWRLEGVAFATPIEGSPNAMEAVASSSDGEQIASADEAGTVRLWTLGSGAITLSGTKNLRVSSLAFSPDGTQLVAGGVYSREDGAVRLWTLEDASREPARALPEDREERPWGRGRVRSVAFSSDGERIAAGGHDATVRIWSNRGAALEALFEWERGSVRSVAFSRDGRRIAVGGAALGGPDPGDRSEDEDKDYTVWMLTRGDDGSWSETFLENGNERSVRSIAFSPADEEFVSGGQDGKVLLWTAVGDAWTPMTLYRHERGKEITSVAFSSDGEWLAWGSVDGVVRLDEVVRLKGLSQAARGDRSIAIARCDARAPVDVRFVADTDHVLVGCSDRWLVVDTGSGEVIGTLFPSDRGLLAIVPTVGVWFPSKDSGALVEWVDDELDVLDEGSLPADTPDTRHFYRVLFDNWKLRDEIAMFVVGLGDRIVKLFTAQHPLVQVLSLSSLVYAIFATLVFGVYAFAPWRLAHWSLGTAADSDPPPWKWLVEMVTLVRWVGSWDRPRKDWLRRFRQDKGLERLCFTERRPVAERERYGELGSSPVRPAWFDEDATERFLWIHGPGGSGKTALACHLAREALADGERWPMPLLVDGDWNGTLVDKVAQELTEKVAQVLGKPQDDCRLTASMVKRLGSLGYLCPIVDSLGERADPDALSCVKDAITENHFLHMIVTSRDAPPPGLAPEKLCEAEVPTIGKGDVRAFVESYIDDESERQSLQRRLYRLLDGASGMPNALFLRIAIEQMGDGSGRTPRRTDLVRRYVKASHKSTHLGEESFRRAACLAALEAVRNERLVPTELTREHLIDTLNDRAETEVFLHEDLERTVEPATVIKALESCGILRYSHADALRFTYDPVAECLAAWYLARKLKGDLSKEPWRRAGKLTGSGFARAMRELRADEVPESEEA